MMVALLWDKFLLPGEVKSKINFSQLKSKKSLKLLSFVKSCITIGYEQNYLAISKKQLLEGVKYEQ